MRILAVTTLRNEAPFIVEWVAHMRAIGVTDLLVYTNDCDDGTDALLAVLANHGILHHIIQGVSSGSPSRVNVGTPDWLTDRQMQDLLGRVARGAGAHVAPKTPPCMITAFDHVLDVPLEDRLSKTLSWLSDLRRAASSENGAARTRAYH